MTPARLAIVAMHVRRQGRACDVVGGELHVESLGCPLRFRLDDDGVTEPAVVAGEVMRRLELFEVAAHVRLFGRECEVVGEVLRVESLGDPLWIAVHDTDGLTPEEVAADAMEQVAEREAPYCAVVE